MFGRLLKVSILSFAVTLVISCTNGLLQTSSFGSFRYPIDFYANVLATPAPGSMGFYVAFADFQNNGSTDFVFTNGANATAYSNNGLGGFTSLFGNPAMGGTARGVITADFNFDGYMDFAGIDNTNNQVQIFMNNAGASFFAPTNYTVSAGANAQELRSGDFDQDGDIDLVAAKFSPNLICVLTNTGGGIFSICNNLATTFGPSRLQVADVNNDGDPDIVAVENGAIIGIFLGAGGTTFAAETTAPLASTGQNIEVVDFDLDGKKDILVSHGAGSAGVQFLKGNGNGTFQAATSAASGPTPNNYIAAGDLNGDGFSDFVLVNDTVGSTVYVYQGNGNGTFSSAATLSNVGCSSANNIYLKDLNNDNRLDIIVICRGLNQISILLHK